MTNKEHVMVIVECALLLGTLIAHTAKLIAKIARGGAK